MANYLKSRLLSYNEDELEDFLQSLLSLGIFRLKKLCPGVIYEYSICNFHGLERRLG